MKPVSRRDMLKAGLLAPAVAAAAHGLGPISAAAIQAAQKEPASLPIGEATASAKPGADAGKRITIEFDGAYRESMVAFNGFYIGRHSGGYDPFHFDVTDFAYPGQKNVLLVRVDPTLSDGWFYEGAGIYRHVWLVKTHPVHVKQWGTFVSAKVAGGDATLSIRTEVNNHGKGAENARVTSTILDASGKSVGKAATAPASIAEGGDQSYEQ